MHPSAKAARLRSHLRRRANRLAAQGLVRLAPRLAHRLALKRELPPGLAHAEIEEAILPALVDPAREAIDVGANLGRYTKLLAGLAAHVHALEPDPRLADFLRRVGYRNVSVVEAAASAARGTAELLVPGPDRASHSATASLEAEAVGAAGRVERIETVPLDGFAERPIGFVKIDVEGHEISVLAGARGLVARRRPVLLVEAEDRHRPGAVDVLRRFAKETGYGGFFLRRGRALPLSEFRAAEMQDPAALVPGRPRIALDYVNNFVLMPEGPALAAAMEEAEARVARVPLPESAPRRAR